MPQTIIHLGDCQEVLLKVPLVDAVVTDPPYGLKFMGQEWDHGVPSSAVWEIVLGAMKPGAFLLAFGGTRTYHRLACAIEDAGFEIRDCIMWVYGSGFPKSLNVSKAIDRRGGYPQLAREIGQALKTERVRRGLTAASCDRKFCGGTSNWSWFEGRPGGQRAPTPKTFAKIVEAWSSLGPLASKVEAAEREVTAKGQSGKTAIWQKDGTERGHDVTAPATDAAKQWEGWGTALKPAWEPIIVARKPLNGTVAANVLEHGTGGLNIDACRVGISKGVPASVRRAKQGAAYGDLSNDPGTGAGWDPNVGRWPANLIHDDSDEVVELFPETKSGGGGSAARFFYCAEASKAERGEGNDWATVKPLALMRYLCRLVTPPNGTVLDPFMSSGSTLVAAALEDFHAVGVDKSERAFEITESRIESKGDLLMARDKVKHPKVDCFLCEKPRAAKAGAWIEVGSLGPHRRAHEVCFKEVCTRLRDIRRQTDNPLATLEMVEERERARGIEPPERNPKLIAQLIREHEWLKSKRKEREASA